MESLASWHITSFYRFLAIPSSRLQELQTTLSQHLSEGNMFGLVLIAPEGVNGTVAGSLDALGQFKRFLGSLLQLDDLRFKDSVSEVRPFRRLGVEIRTEIVGLKRPDLVPEPDDGTHLSPTEWQAWLESDRDRLIIDTRNRYEVLAGKFKGAVDPDLAGFSEWPAFLDNAHIPKDLPVLLYCTGGIRCEKALLEMKSRGYENVYQLRDGILGYLAEYPNAAFEGECFVFDDRVTVDQQLRPSGNFGICPGCGLTAADAVACEWCGKSFFYCVACRGVRPTVCCKTCLDRWKRRASRHKVTQG